MRRRGKAFPELGPVEDVFLALRSQQFVIDREQQIAAHRGSIKPDIIWNTEHGPGADHRPASPGPSGSGPPSTAGSPRSSSGSTSS